MTATAAPRQDVPDPEPGKRSPEEVLCGVAQELAAGDALVWQRLLAAHRPDRSGRCRLCSGVLWPCTLQGVAERAQSISHSDGGSGRSVGAAEPRPAAAERLRAPRPPTSGRPCA